MATTSGAQTRPANARRERRELLEFDATTIFMKRSLTAKSILTDRLEQNRFCFSSCKRGLSPYNVEAGRAPLPARIESLPEESTPNSINIIYWGFRDRILFYVTRRPFVLFFKLLQQCGKDTTHFTVVPNITIVLVKLV